MTCQAPYRQPKTNCVITPACPGSPAVPASYRNQPILSWDSGADSVTYQTADCNVVFQMPGGLIGVLIGFKEGSRARPTLPNLITHGFYFCNILGSDTYQVCEAGQTLGGTYDYVASSDTFEIRRVGTTVYYLVNGVIIYTSTVPNTGVVFVNVCMYGSGDSAPGATGTSLAASFSYAATSGFGDGEHVTFADTSTGSGIAWRAWSFSGISPQLLVPALGPPTGATFSVYKAIVGTSITQTASTQLAYFPSASGSYPVTLTITDANGNTSSITQDVTLPL